MVVIDVIDSTSVGIVLTDMMSSGRLRPLIKQEGFQDHCRNKLKSPVMSKIVRRHVKEDFKLSLILVFS